MGAEGVRVERDSWHKVTGSLEISLGEGESPSCGRWVGKRRESVTLKGRLQTCFTLNLAIPINFKCILLEPSIPLLKIYLMHRIV